MAALAPIGPSKFVRVARRPPARFEKLAPDDPPTSRESCDHLSTRLNPAVTTATRGSRRTDQGALVIGVRTVAILAPASPPLDAEGPAPHLATMDSLARRNN